MLLRALKKQDFAQHFLLSKNCAKLIWIRNWSWNQCRNGNQNFSKVGTGTEAAINHYGSTTLRHVNRIFVTVELPYTNVFGIEYSSGRKNVVITDMWQKYDKNI
jgi:hypothetical protein